MNNIQKLMLEHLYTGRKYSVLPETVHQNIDEYMKRKNKNIVFSEWGNKLHVNDTLPRGRFFKTFKRKIIMIDEA